MPKDMDLYICSKCGHEIYAHERPLPIKWSDGHVCHFDPARVIELEEASENQDDDEGEDEQDDYGYAQQGKSFD